MPDLTLEGLVKDTRGKVIEIVEVEVTALPDVVVTGTSSYEEPVVVTGQEGKWCRTVTTSITRTQKMQREKYTYYEAVESSFWGWVGGILIVVGIGIVVVIAVGLSGGAAIPVLVTAGVAGGAAASLTATGALVLGVGFAAAGSGVTIVFGDIGDDYSRGALLRTVGPTDVPVGQPIITQGTPTYSTAHPCND